MNQKMIRMGILIMGGLLEMATWGGTGESNVAFDEDVFASVQKDETSRALLFTTCVTAMREAAYERPLQTLRYYFDDEAYRSWGDLVLPELNELTQSDFFLGGILMTGPVDETSGIVSIYNPWWDAILLMSGKIRDDVPTDAAAIKITDAYLLSGETFRGEPKEADEKSIRRTTVVPENDPISVELWRSVAGTRAAFLKYFPSQARYRGLLPCRGSILNGLDTRLEMRRIAVRAALRLKLKLILLKDAKATGLAAHVVKMARDGNLFQLYSYFKEPNSRKLLEPFSEMPPLFRKDFRLYGYVPTAEGALYIAVNKRIPRLYVTATIPKDVPKRPASFEWFDLSKSDEMLKLWKARSEKEVAK